MDKEVEARFQRTEVQLELLARYSTTTADRLDKLTERVDQTSRNVANLADAVASLVRLFERHIGDGHGGKEDGQPPGQ